MEKKSSKFRLKFLFQEVDLREGVFIIGRSPSCNLTLEDPLVSRRHVKISVYEDHATLDDLGSRNGTLVNREPVFEDYQLRHADTIRIGSQDLTFIEEKHRVSKMLHNTRPPLACPHCDTPFDPDSSQCGMCGTLLIPDNLCMHCRTPVDNDALYCIRCGAPIGHDDSTIPVELAGSSSGWTDSVIYDVISSALRAKRYEQAARLLDGQMKLFTRACLAGQLNEKTLVTLSGYNIQTADKLRDERRLRWVVKYFSQYGITMPEQLLFDLASTAAGLCDIHQELEQYLAILKAEKRDKPEDVAVKNLLQKILKERSG